MIAPATHRWLDRPPAFGALRGYSEAGVRRSRRLNSTQLTRTCGDGEAHPLPRRADEAGVANMRALGLRALAVPCALCQQEASLRT